MTPLPENAVQKIALVTGASRGIGAATAKALAARGCRVALLSRNEKELSQLSTAIEKDHPGQSLVLRADLSSPTEITEAFERCYSVWGPLDILVNNAAQVLTKELTAVSHIEWDHLFAVNVRAPFLCTQLAFQQMRSAGKGGSIVNISSLAGLQGRGKFPNTAAYAASKHAIVGLTEASAVEGRPYGIHVNCVAPGAVDTEMLKKALPHLKARAKPEDIAELIIWLCDSPAAGTLNGSVIEVNSNE